MNRGLEEGETSEAAHRQQVLSAEMPLPHHRKGNAFSMCVSSCPLLSREMSAEQKLPGSGRGIMYGSRRQGADAGGKAFLADLDGL